MTTFLDVALVPAETRRWRDTVCVLVDAVRASTTIVTALDRGARAVIPVGSVRVARSRARELGAVLAGEVDGLPPPGFDLGNAPSELAKADLDGRLVVLRTSNGTGVLRQLAGSPAVLIGCLLNATAVGSAAIELAAEGGRIGIVCAGRDGGFVLDDALAAGVIVETIVEGAGRAGRPVVLADAARAALHLHRGLPDLEAGFRASASGRRLLELGLEEDLAFCLRHDASRLVPILVDGASPRLERWTNDHASEPSRNVGRHAAGTSQRGQRRIVV